MAAKKKKKKAAAKNAGGKKAAPKAGGKKAGGKKAGGKKKTRLTGGKKSGRKPRDTGDFTRRGAFEALRQSARGENRRKLDAISGSKNRVRSARRILGASDGVSTDG